MRRLCMLLCVCLLALPALAAGEFSVSTPFSSTEPEGILAAWAAEQLSLDTVYFLEGVGE